MFPVLAAGALLGTGMYRKSSKHQSINNIDPILIPQRNPGFPDRLEPVSEHDRLVLPSDRSMTIDDARDIEFQHGEDAYRRRPIEPGTYSDLAGIHMTDMGHNNMLPFFRRNAGAQHTEHHSELAERRMDTFTGATPGLLPLRSSDQSILHEQPPAF